MLVIECRAYLIQSELRQVSGGFGNLGSNRSHQGAVPVPFFSVSSFHLFVWFLLPSILLFTSVLQLTE